MNRTPNIFQLQQGMQSNTFLKILLKYSCDTELLRDTLGVFPLSVRFETCRKRNTPITCSYPFTRDMLQFVLRNLVQVTKI